MAQPGERISARSLSRSERCNPKHAGGCRRIALDRDACEDPVIFLIPKHLLWAEHEYAEPIRAVPLGQARKRSDGSDVTLVAWGNTVEKSLEAIDKIDKEISIELIDLRSIVPWDKTSDRGIRAQDRPAGRGSGGHGKLQCRSDD